MKKLLLFLVFSMNLLLLYGQNKVAPKPKYVIIVNDRIISMEDLNAIETSNIKGMYKGVTEEERDRLAKILGDSIGDKEFIIKVDLYTESEKKQRENNTNVAVNNNATNTKVDEGYILNINDTAKDFMVKMIDGKNIKLSELKGKVVLVNFWATWCAPCLMEFYDIPSKIIEPFKNKEFVFLPISRGESKEVVSKKMLKLKQDGIDFNAGIDPNETIWNLYAKNGIPKSFLIDQNGIIRYVSTGNADGNLDKLAMEIKKLLGK